MGWIKAGLADTLAVHAALLPNGFIIYFGGSDYDSANHDDIHGIYNFDHTRLFNCVTGAITSILSPSTDAFCCGHCLIEGGRLVISGGTEHYPTGEGYHHHHWPGIKDTWIFDSRLNSWMHKQPMNLMPRYFDEATYDNTTDTGGRWYPTLISLADGSILTISGHPALRDVRHTNNTPEIYYPDKDIWIINDELGGIGREDIWNNDKITTPGFQVQYPRMHVLSEGNVFCATPLFDPTDEDFSKRHELSSLIYNYKNQNYHFVGGAITDPSYTNNSIVGGHNTTSVFLPLLLKNNFQPRVLLCGSRIPLVINLNDTNPMWRPTIGNRNNPTNTPSGNDISPIRYNLNATILPTGDVFISGGIADIDKNDTFGVLNPEIYHPETEQWETILEDTKDVVRNYHSVALLMPDGRIWSAGSNRNGVDPATAGKDTHEPQINIYEPWYYHQRRPRIAYNPTGFPYRLSEADDFVYRIHSPDTSDIKMVALLRAGSATHAFNSDQRFVELNMKYNGGDELLVTPPSSAGIAPPGDYLLFLINANGVPSEGKFVWVGNLPPDWSASGEIVAGIAADNSIYVFKFTSRQNWTRGQITWASMTGPLTSWLTGNVAHLAGIATDNNLYVLWQSPGIDWQAANISQITGATVIGAVNSWVFGDVEYIAGIASNNSIEIFWYSPQTNWQHGNIPWASMKGPLTNWTVGNVWHLAGVATDNNLYVLWQSPGMDWQAANISQMTGATVVGAVTSWVVGDIEYVAGIAANNSIEIFWYSPQTNWQHGNIPWASMKGPLTSWLVGNVWHLAGVATDDNLYVLWQSPGMDWQAANISQMTGTTIVGTVTSWVVGDVEHLAGISSDGSVYVFWYSPGRNWASANISSIARMDGTKITSSLTSWKEP